MSDRMLRHFSGIAGCSSKQDQIQRGNQRATTHAASDWFYTTRIMTTAVCAPFPTDFDVTPPRRVETCAYCRTYQEGVGPCESCGAKLKLSQLSEPR